jgi:hypothetical protein
MTFALVVNLVVMILLAGTIYFCWKLQDQLARFRNNRQEMDRLVRDLNAAVERAQSSIGNLRETAKTSGDDLQRIMNKATGLSDELQLMTESANNMATRLENASSRNRSDDNLPSPRSVPKKEDSEPHFGFSIRDPEFDGSVERDDGVSSPTTPEDDWNGVEHLQSRAEQDLFRALQKAKKGPRSVM